MIYSSANVDPVQNCNLGHLQKREILIFRQRKKVTVELLDNHWEYKEKVEKHKIPIV